MTREHFDEARAEALLEAEFQRQMDRLHKLTAEIYIAAARCDAWACLRALAEPQRPL